MADMQFRVTGRGVELAREAMFGKQREQQFGRGADDAAARDMAAGHLAVRVGHGHMQMRAVGRHRAGQRQDFEVAVQRRGRFGAREAQLGHAQAADALNDEAGAHGAPAEYGFHGEAHVVARRQPNGMDLHAGIRLMYHPQLRSERGANASRPPRPFPREHTHPARHSRRLQRIPYQLRRRPPGSHGCA
ncbi:hypothetical protein PUN4_190017 [Paraburkholderia unamae]|nr:hypothetical protein PUN4_190017 [Paraburkholderia unamae]